VLNPSTTPEVRCSNAAWDLLDTALYFSRGVHGAKAYVTEVASMFAGEGYVVVKGERPLGGGDIGECGIGDGGVVYYIPELLTM
jgi:hypothetical protein